LSYGARQGDDVLARLAAGGFRDITRIASSDSQLWAAISLQSGPALIEQIDGYNGSAWRIQAGTY
jgi:prephenate dehydrogenase